MHAGMHVGSFQRLERGRDQQAEREEVVPVERLSRYAW